MTQQSQRRLRNFLIYPQYQIKYVFWTTFSGLFLILCNIFVFYHFVSENYKILVDLSPMEDDAKAQLYRELHHILLWMGVFSICFILVVSLLGVVLSHRTAGPMFHFKRVFQDIQKGKLDTRIRLRPKDDFLDVADECNKMIDYLQKK